MTGFLNDLIGGFTGSNAKGRLDDGKAQFDAAAKDGFNLANTNFSTGYTQATNNIVDARKRAEAGYGSAENSVKWGAADASSRIGTGAAKQAGAINDAFDQAFSSAGKGFDTARGDINTSTDKALGFQRDALGNAISVLRPGIDAYKGYEGIVQNYAGVNGPQAQSDAFSSFTDTNSPLVQARNARANEELQAFQNARGITGGRAAMAASRAVAQRQADDYANYMANIQQAAGRTGSMAGQAASMTNAAGANEAALEAARGRSLGDLSTGQAALEASLATGRGGALSGIRRPTATRSAAAWPIFASAAPTPRTICSGRRRASTPAIMARWPRTPRTTTTGRPTRRRRTIPRSQAMKARCLKTRWRSAPPRLAPLPRSTRMA